MLTSTPASTSKTHVTSKIEDLPNLGPYMARRLADIGVNTAGELRALGAVEAYRRLKFQFGREMTLNALWAMEAALVGLDCRRLSNEHKQALRTQLEQS